MEKSRENRIYRAIGLMSGTAMDGIDAAMIETDGNTYTKSLGFASIEHADNLREKLKCQLNKPHFDKDVEREFTCAQIPVIESLLDKTNMSVGDIDIIGFHGQTTHHDPDKGITIQMGDGELLSSETKIDVVYDFRKNDMKFGGQGAPFLPIYHRALSNNANLKLPVIILNLGGVGNITWISGDDMVGFDTGPGRVKQDLLGSFLSSSYFLKKYPKSLDRNDFNGLPMAGLSLEDGVATLAEITVQSVKRGVDLCPQKPNEIFVTGGGRHNNFIMNRLGDVMDCPIKPVDGLGWDGDAMEAEGFAYMAVRSLLGLPISFPNTTGCEKPVTGGVFVGSRKQVA